MQRFATKEKAGYDWLKKLVHCCVCNELPQHLQWPASMFAITHLYVGDGRVESAWPVDQTDIAVYQLALMQSNKCLLHSTRQFLHTTQHQSKNLTNQHQKTWTITQKIINKKKHSHWFRFSFFLATHFFFFLNTHTHTQVAWLSGE